MKKEEMYYIQDSRSFIGNSVIWWGIDSKGYTTDISKAGKYTKDEAFTICKNRDTDIAWLCSHVDKNIKQHVDMQYLKKKYSRNWKNKKK